MCPERFSGIESIMYVTYIFVYIVNYAHVYLNIDIRNLIYTFHGGKKQSLFSS